MSWLAYAEYEDGHVIERVLPYYENGNYRAEDERQYTIEEWLICRAHPQSPAVFYSVSCEVE